jgi:hypothetical protein
MKWGGAKAMKWAQKSDWWVPWRVGENRWEEGMVMVLGERWWALE